MVKRPLIRRECEDCTTRAEVECLDRILDELREVLRTPEGKDIVQHAEEIMRKMDDVSK